MEREWLTIRRIVIVYSLDGHGEWHRKANCGERKPESAAAGQSRVSGDGRMALQWPLAVADLPIKHIPRPTLAVTSNLDNDNGGFMTT